MTREPSPEDMSYLSDHNIEWCCEHYFRELCKRSRGKSDAFLNHLNRIWLIEHQSQETRLPSVHRKSA